MSDNPTILEAAAAGDRRAELQAMRVRIAAAMDDPHTAARDLSSLARRQMDLAREIAALDEEEQEARREREVTPDADWDPDEI